MTTPPVDYDALRARLEASRLCMDEWARSVAAIKEAQREKDEALQRLARARRGTFFFLGFLRW
jgi:hypothetical protein